MKKIIVASLLLSSSLYGHAHAASCDGIPEGTVVRIDKGNGPLTKAQVQDQDGLGTCYANQASTMLQAVLPGNPNLSYLNLALYYAKDYSDINDQNNFLKTVKTANGSSEQVNLVDGGFGCKAIDSAIARQKESKQGVLCQSVHSSLEHSFFNPNQNGHIDRENRQSKVLTEASKYYASYLKTFGIDSNSRKNISKRHEADKFSNALTKFVNTNISEFGRSTCSESNPKAIEDLLSNAMTKTLGNYPQCIKNNKLVNNIPECKLFDDLGIIITLNGSKGKTVGYFMGADVRKKFESQLPALMAMSSSPQDLQNQLIDFMVNNLNGRTPSAQKNAFKSNLAKNFQSEDKLALANEYDRVVIGDVQKCIESQFMHFFRDKKNFLEKARADKFLCDYGELIGNAHALANALPNGTIKSMNDFMDLLVLKEANLHYDSALFDVVANDCRPSERISIPSTVSCSTVPLNINPKTANDSLKMNFLIKENRQEILSSINSQLPIGLDLCTRYWNDPGFEFNKISEDQKYNKCQETGKHGIHAITMVGYRCKNNKVQYLAQNSWGPHWQLKDKSFEIEKGKIWLDEEALFMNILRYNKITK